MIYLDNAATTGKKPEIVVHAVEKALRQYSSNPGRSGHSASVKASVAIFSVREKISRFFGGGGPENVIFTAGCTHSINYVLKGVLQEGDHVVVSDMEHNAVMRPLVSHHIRFDVAEVSWNDDETVENFRNLISPKTKMIFITGASNVFGKCLPIDKIGQLCAESNILFGVDAAQIAGLKQIDMVSQQIDFLCVAPHKGIYAPMGIGILIARKPLPFTVIEGGTGTESVNLFQPDALPERLESGTINLPGIFGVSAGLDFLRTVGGQERILKEEIRKTARIYHRLAAMDSLILYTPCPTDCDWMPVLSFNVTEKNSTEVAELLNQYGIAVRAGLHCASQAHRKMGTLDTGTVRISPSVFTTDREIERFLAVMHEKI